MRNAPNGDRTRHRVRIRVDNEDLHDLRFRNRRFQSKPRAGRTTPNAIPRRHGRPEDDAGNTRRTRYALECRSGNRHRRCADTTPTQMPAERMGAIVRIAPQFRDNLRLEGLHVAGVRGRKRQIRRLPVWMQRTGPRKMDHFGFDPYRLRLPMVLHQAREQIRIRREEEILPTRKFDSTIPHGRFVVLRNDVPSAPAGQLGTNRPIDHPRSKLRGAGIVDTLRPFAALRTRILPMHPVAVADSRDLQVHFPSHGYP